jgi:hypothetical protein
MSKIDTMRKYFNDTALSKALTSEERSKFLHEVLRAGGDKDTILELIEEEKEDKLPPEVMLVGAFDWNKTKYGAVYWQAVYKKVRKELYGIESIDSMPKGKKTFTFEKRREYLERYLEELGYKQASMHKDDKHTWYSRDKRTRVEMNNGMLQVASHAVNVHSIGYKDIYKIAKSHDAVLITLTCGVSIVVGE